MPEGQEGDWATLREGKAEVLHKPGEAFYNKAQVQNRDLSIAVIREFIKVRERDLKAKAESGKGAAAAAAGDSWGYWGACCYARSPSPSPLVEEDAAQQ